jgi:hypothetical protein
MANTNENKPTREQIEKALACETAEELMALVKANGHEITKEEAEACMAELAYFKLDETKLDEATLEQVAGGQAAGGSPNSPKVKISDILKSTTAILMFL